jgi:hypothetical protein
MKKLSLIIAVFVFISGVQVFGLTNGHEITENHSDKPISVMPKVISTDPANKAKDVEVNKIITVTFNMIMDPSTITNTTFILKQGDELVIGNVQYNKKKATFSPFDKLKAGNVYTVTLTTGVKNVAGDTFPKDFVYTFTTVALPPAVKQ